MRVTWREVRDGVALAILGVLLIVFMLSIDSIFRG